MGKSANTDTVTETGRRSQVKFLLVAAIVVHLCTTSMIFVIGRCGWFPSQIFPNGIGKFASDGIRYQEQLSELSNTFKDEGLTAWATKPVDLHVRLYSLPLLAAPRGTSANVLLIEPVNLAYYLGILLLIFMIGKLIFDHRTGLMAAAVVALWPSFLLHTTQLLRDPLLILCILVFVWGVIESLQRDLTWRRTLWLSVASVIALVCVRIVRPPVWYIMLAAVGIAVGLLISRAFINKRLHKPAAAFALIIVATAAVAPRFQSIFRPQQGSETAIPSKHEKVLQGTTLLEQVAVYRESFKFEENSRGEIERSDNSSIIDPTVTFHSRSDIVRYVPRAIVIGLFAPFPNLWLQPGHRLGYVGRVVAGLETSLTYMIELFAVIGLWSARRKLSVWFIMMLTSLGLIGLGIIVANVGALYRMRYSFWVLIVILGAGGLSFLVNLSKAKESELARQTSGRYVST
jgi:putative peptidoglycan lipid II flippase